MSLEQIKTAERKCGSMVAETSFWTIFINAINTIKMKRIKHLFEFSVMLVLETQFFLLSFSFLNSSSSFAVCRFVTFCTKNFDRKEK